MDVRSDHPSSSGKKRRWIVIVCSLLLLVGSIAAWPWIQTYRSFAQKEHITASVLRGILTNTYTPSTKGERISLVIVGNAGGSHDGPDLTDTILYMSLDKTKPDGLVISVPRDLWIFSLKQRINVAYAIGEKKRPGGGLILAKATLEEVLGTKPDYIWRIDFTGFIRIIDLVGGITVDVAESIDDPKYPIAGKENDLCDGDPLFSCRYEHLIIQKGKQHMDGSLALKYARSRHATGDEGTDFSRGKRQQQIVLALKEKFSQIPVWKYPTLAQAFWHIFTSSAETDMPLGHALLFARRIVSLSSDQLRRIGVDTGDEKTGKKGYLVNPPTYEYGGAWVLIPRTKTYAEIHSYVACHLKDPLCPLHP